MSLRSYLFRHREFNILPNDIVLDLGSGGDPIFRANILVDRYIDSDYQRAVRGVFNRPTICADGCALPLKDKSIDFVYCSHVIEHIPDPAPFLQEIQRVGKRGLIEAPHGDYEKIHPRELHLWYVYANNGKLKMIQKQEWNEFPDVASMYSNVRRSIRKYYGFLGLNWNSFNARYFWNDTINFEVVKPNDFDPAKFSRIAGQETETDRAFNFRTFVKSWCFKCLHRVAFKAVCLLCLCSEMLSEISF